MANQFETSSTTVAATEDGHNGRGRIALVAAVAAVAIALTGPVNSISPEGGCSAPPALQFDLAPATP